MAKAQKILVVDDETHPRAVLKEHLSELGHEVSEASSGTQALDFLKGSGKETDLVITDLMMPGMDGIELIQKGRENSGQTEFMVVTAHGTIETAIRAIKAGAYDYLLKPIEFEELDYRVDRLFKTKRLESENREFRGDQLMVVGESRSMREMMSGIYNVAETDSNVLITGETGVGKEVVARFIHQNSRRAKKKFVALNCSALPENLIESELFGHERGAFTGADRRAIGLFEQASGGSLFLDELGEMTLSVQPKLLRALEDRKIRRVGGSTDIPVDVRLITATHRDLAQEVKTGRFREDLFYRLNVVSIKIPPLRNRLEDLPELIDHLVQRFSRTTGRKVERVDSGVIERLKTYRFPGNVRELANIVERAMIFMKGAVLSVDCLPPLTAEGGGASGVPLGGNLPQVGTLAERVAQFETQTIQASLEAHKGNIEEVARSLGVSRSTLYSKISKYGIQ